MLSSVLIVILQVCWELPVSLFINVHTALFLILADKTNVKFFLFCLFYHFPKN